MMQSRWGISWKRVLNMIQIESLLSNLTITVHQARIPSIAAQGRIVKTKPKFYTFKDLDLGK